MNTNKLSIWLMAGAFIFMCAALLGLSVDANGNLVEAQEQNHQKVSSSDGSVSQPKVVCPMEWTAPVTSFNAGAMPPTGAVSFDWSDHPAASDYDLTVMTPNGSPVSYDVDGSAKELYLENYTQTGTYLVMVTALNADGSPACSITMTFDLPVASNGIKARQGEQSEGEPANSNPSSVIPSNPVMPPQPVPTATEVEIH